MKLCHSTQVLDKKENDLFGTLRDLYNNMNNIYIFISVTIHLNKLKEIYNGWSVNWRFQLMKRL